MRSGEKSILGYVESTLEIVLVGFSGFGNCVAYELVLTLCNFVWPLKLMAVLFCIGVQVATSAQFNRPQLSFDLK